MDGVERSYAKGRTHFRDLLQRRITIFCRPRERNGYRRQVISVYREDDTGPSILRGQPAGQSRRDLGHRQLADGRGVSTGISDSIDSNRSHGQAGQGLQHRNA